MIRLEKVTKDYINGKNCTNALRGIDLNIKEGSFLAIVGTSGSGKSTLLNILGGMDNVTDGKYYFFDELVSDYNYAKLQRFRKEKISFVFQNFALMNRYSVYENVEMPLLIRRVKNKKKIIMDCLERMGIADMAKKYPTQLSGGQQQRCAIARALIKNPKLLLCDEPTGALDSKTSRDILILLEKINAKYGTTMLIVTHNNSIKNMVDQVIMVKDGLIKKNYKNETKIPAAELEDL